MIFSERIKNNFRMFRKYFSSYAMLGLSLLLLSIILDSYTLQQPRAYYITIFLKLLEGIGVSILIAAIFTFASSSIEFIEQIKKLLEDIVLQRNFLSNLDPEKKKEALKIIIQPSLNEKNSYPNIGEYYDFSIKKTLEVGKLSVRSNYNINCRAYYNETEKKVIVEGTYNYRLFPSSEGFKDIIVGFEDPKSYCSYITVSDPMGNQKKFVRIEDESASSDPNTIELKQYNEGGDITYRAVISINDFGEGKNHLDVELNVTEHGDDHWKLIQFKALQPTDGFRFQVHCDGNINITDHSIFVVGAKSYLHTSNGEKKFSVSCNQWINEGTGLCVLVSIPHTIES